MTREERVTPEMLEAAAAATGCPASGKLGPKNREFFTQIYCAMRAVEPSPDEWEPIETAPRDGTPVLVQMRGDIYPDLRPEREDLKPWNGVRAVMRSRGDISAWCFAAPVGQGGFPDEWMVGWKALPTHPNTKGGGE